MDLATVGVMTLRRPALLSLSSERSTAILQALSPFVALFFQGPRVNLTSSQPEDFDPQDPPIKTIDQASGQPSHSFPQWKSPVETASHSLNQSNPPILSPRGNPSGIRMLLI